MELWNDSTKTVNPTVLTDQEMVTRVVVQLNRGVVIPTSSPCPAVVQVELTLDREIKDGILGYLLSAEGTGAVDMFEYETTRG
jgi:hypothetical protein